MYPNFKVGMQCQFFKNCNFLGSVLFIRYLESDGSGMVMEIIRSDKLNKDF